MTKDAPRDRIQRGGVGQGWKTGILAASLGAVLLGSAVVAVTEKAPPSQVVAPILQTSAAPASVRGGQGLAMSQNNAETIVLPEMPTKPIFVRPITRTRPS